MTSTDYPMPSQTPPPLELEAVTSEPARVTEPTTEVEGLTIQEAASAYGLSESTVRRLIKGKPPKVNAVKVPGPKGIEYRIPPNSLEVLGYKVKVTQSGAVLTAARANLEAESLATKVRDLESTLEVERIRREAAEQRSVDLEQSLSDLREVIAKLPKALEPAAPRRRWFKKS
jgi:hypothetical protein